MQFKSIAKVAPCAILSHPFSFKVMLSQDSIHGVLQLGGIPKIILSDKEQVNKAHILLFLKMRHFLFVLCSFSR